MTASASALVLDDVSFRYGDDNGSHLVLDRVRLAIEPGEFVVAIGRSGCGKTTLLNLAAGFLAPSGGRIVCGGRPVTGPGAERAVVFQEDALLPWASTRDNVALPLRIRGVGAAERARRADALLSEVGLSGAGDKPVWALSGGMRQRVGLARALAAEPKFLLMDEPLGALDAMTRARMQGLLLKVWADSGTGVLLITHGVEEALFLATRIIVMEPGPGRIVREARFDFGRRVLAGEPARAVRAAPEFIAAREAVLDWVFGREEA